MKRKYCVYMHTFPNGKVYIGQTMQNPEYRFQNGRGYKGCRYVYSAIKKYGWDNIKHEILIDDLTSEEADYWEEYYITAYQSNTKAKGYNLRTGGTSGYKYTDEARKKMSDAQTGRKKSEQTKKRHSEALLKYYSKYTVSEETRQKLREANTGKSHPLSEKAKEKAIQNIKHHQFRKGHAPSEKAMQTLREKNSRRVIQWDLSGAKIKEYASITEASRLNGLTVNAVGNCVRGYTLTTNGYFWTYADEPLDISSVDMNHLAKSVNTINKPRKILQITPSGNVVKEFCSISDAKRETGLSHIGEALRNQRRKAGGYIWRYADGD